MEARFGNKSEESSSQIRKGGVATTREKIEDDGHGTYLHVFETVFLADAP
jgi:hypothetical protein